MADNQVLSTTVDVDDERPLSVRRKRRNGSIGSSTQLVSRPYLRSTSLQKHGISTPPQTPKRSKKRVRFSDPGLELQCTSSPSSSSGLTPFIRRTALSTPSSKRRHSTPSTLWNRADYNDTPFSGTLQFEPLRQVLDGRVKRRLRRHRLSEEINAIEFDKRHEAKARKSEVERLKEELAAKDAEVQSMRDEQEIVSQIEGESGQSLSTNTTLSTKVQELEQEIRELKAELERKVTEEPQTPGWTLNARDPFNFHNDDDDDDDDHIITNYDEDFRESMMDDDEMVTTPTRLNTSFPSPPSTMPNTPCRNVNSINASIQTSLPIPDPENDLLKSQLKSLQSEITKLNSAIAFRDEHQTRLTEKLSEFLPPDESYDHTTLDSALDKVLTQLALSQSQGIESTNAFSALSAEISNLGFPVAGPDEVLEMISKQFRQARLDLEYLTPGEVVEGFENHKLLTMLISRIKVLVDKIKGQDDCIDQYHEQELLLRQQLDARVSSMDSLKKKLYLSNSVVEDLREEVEQTEMSNERLQSALNGYRDEVHSLEKLIERIETQGREVEGQLQSEIQEGKERYRDEALKHDITRADGEGKEIILVELERRLSTALQSISELESQLSTLLASNRGKETTLVQLQSSIHDREREHGSALALRDARVAELRREIERVNEALKTAHSTILELRNGNQALEGQIQGEKTRGLIVVQAMKDQLTRALETGMGYVNGDVSVVEHLAPEESVNDGQRTSGTAPVRRGRFLDSGLARKGGKKLRRRYDSGLGFLEEESDDDVMHISTDVEDAVDLVAHF